MLSAHYEGDSLLEQGVMAELDGKPNPELFSKALSKFEESLDAMNDLDGKLVNLIALSKQSPQNATFQQALGKILVEWKAPERVTLSHARYANVGTSAHAEHWNNPKNLLEIMEAQRKDLDILRTQMKQTIEAFRSVIPLAEKHEFAAMMLSGREGFADKVQQSVDLVGRYGRFYTSSCMTTIAATMQAYPAGLEWIKDSLPKGRE